MKPFFAPALLALLVAAPILHAQQPGIRWAHRSTPGSSPVRWIRLADDGRTLVVAYEKGYRAWDAENGRLISAWAEDRQPTLAPQDVSPDGQQIAGFQSLPGTSPSILDLRSGASRAVIGAGSGTLRYTPTGSMLLFLESLGHLSAYSMPGYERLWRRGPGERGQFMASSHDDRMLLLLVDGLPSLVEMSTGALLRRLPGAVDLKLAAFGLGSSRVVGHSGKFLYVWDAATGERRQAFPDGSSTLVMRPGGRLAVTLNTNNVAGDSTVRVWDLEREARIHDFAARELVFPLRGAVMTPDERTLIALDANGGISAVDLETGAVTRRSVGSREPIGPRAVAASADGRFVASVSDDARVRNASDGMMRWKLYQYEYPNAVAFSPDGNRIAVASGSDTDIWSIDEQADTARKLFTIPQRFGSDVTYSPDGSIIAIASLDPVVKLYEAANGRMIRELVGHAGWVYGVAFSRDGRLLATSGQDQTINVWTVATGGLLRSFVRHVTKAYDVVFTADGSGVISADEEGRVIHFPFNGEPREFEHVPGTIRTLALSPDGRTLYTGGDRVLAYDVSIGRVIARLDDGARYTYGYNIVATLPRGELLVGTPDGDVVLWGAPGIGSARYDDAGAALRVAPVPASDRIEVRLDDVAAREVRARLYAQTGELVLARDVEHASAGDALVLDLSALPPGLYMLELRGDEVTRHARVVVAR